jgi:hypothetical protein
MADESAVSEALGNAEQETRLGDIGDAVRCLVA